MKLTKQMMLTLQPTRQVFRQFAPYKRKEVPIEYTARILVTTLMVVLVLALVGGQSVMALQLAQVEGEAPPPPAPEQLTELQAGAEITLGLYQLTVPEGSTGLQLRDDVIELQTSQEDVAIVAHVGARPELPGGNEDQQIRLAEVMRAWNPQSPLQPLGQPQNMEQESRLGGEVLAQRYEQSFPGEEGADVVHGLFILHPHDQAGHGLVIDVFTSGPAEGAQDWQRLSDYTQTLMNSISTSQTAAPPLASTTMSTYTNSKYGYQIGHPADWQVEITEEGTEITLNENVGMAIFTYPLSPEEVQNLTQLPPAELLSLMLEGLQEEILNFQVTQTSSRTVAGQQAQVIDFTGTDSETQAPSTGTAIFFVADPYLYVFALAADSKVYAQHQGTFEEMLASFTLTSQTPQSSSEAANPLDPTPATEPENPLAPLNPLAPNDPFVGTFSDERLILTLQGSNGQYSGELTFNNQTFPVGAQGSGNTLSGTFQSDGASFDFTATVEDEVLTFTTDNTTYVLPKQAANLLDSLPGSNEAPQPRASEPPPVAMQAFQSPLSVSVPEGWLVRESVTLTSPNGSANVIVSSESLDAPMTTQAFAEAVEEIVAEFPEYQELEFTEAEVFGEHMGYVRHFEWTPEGTERVTQIQLYYTENDRAYTATAATTTANFEELESQLRQILGKLHIGPQTTSLNHPQGETSQRSEGPTPNGGAYAITFFRDENGNPTTKDQAHSAEIIEYNEEGEAIHSTFGYLNP